MSILFLLLLLILIGFVILAAVAAVVLTVVFLLRKRNNQDIPATSNWCVRCRGPLPNDSLGGLCPRCLLEAGKPVSP